MKRVLFVIHRWFGVAMCLLFALWFASGVVMMYVEYPELTEEERLANLPVLDAGAVTLTPWEAAEVAGITGGMREVRLNSAAGRPAYLLRDGQGAAHTVFADKDELLRGPTPEQVMATIDHSGFGASKTRPRYTGKIDMDQWTVSSNLHEHRPLHRVEVGDTEGSVLYVSDVTGRVVRDTHRRERLWNWLGSTIHWIYPVQLRRYQDFWVNLLIYLSLAGLVSVITGAVIGVMRLRVKSRYRGESLSPYRGVDKWHHVMGLVCMLFLGTFMLSGLMSFAPWGLFDSEFSMQEQVERYTGGAITEAAPFPALDWRTLPAGIKEVQWMRVGGEGHLVLSRSAGERWVVAGKAGVSAGKDPDAAAAAAPGSANAWEVTNRVAAGSLSADILRHRIEQSLPSFLPGAPVTGVEVLTQYDNYYYSRHNRYRPLPVYRVKFADEENTWFHVDGNTGAVITRHTGASRVLRWIYNGLHSLDFTFLTRRGPLWDIAVILLLIPGFIFSVTSVILAWRRVS